MSTTLSTRADACEFEPAWAGFEPGAWCERIDVRDFIQRNYTPYDGDDAFLAPATRADAAAVGRGRRADARGVASTGILDADTDVVSTITSHAAGYVDRDLEVIVGLQTDKPLKRALLPLGGIRMVESALQAYGYELSPRDQARSSACAATARRTTTACSTATRAEMRSARKSGIITGLPDAYGRGRIIGDYRRVALYGVDRLLADKKAAARLARRPRDGARRRSASPRRLAEQYRALEDLQDDGRELRLRHLEARRAPRVEAVQWLYFGYLGAVKEQNGAAMSLGRTSTFLDVYFERDLRGGPAHRERGAGDRRPVRDEAADGALPAHARVQRAVLGRPHVGDRVDRRRGRGRPARW